MAEFSVQGLLDAFKEGADEAFLPIVDKAAERVAAVVKDVPLVSGFVRMLNPTTLSVAKAIGPVAVSGAIGTFLPDSLFKSPQRAALVKGGLSRFVTKLAEIAGPNGQVTKDQVNQVIDDVMGEVLKYDSKTRLVHLNSCPESRRNFSDVTMAMVLEREMAVAPCCFSEAQNKLSKAEEKKSSKKDEPILGLADLYQRLPSDADRQVMRFWFATLNKEQLSKLSAHADLPSEGPFIVDCLKDGVPTEKILTLIEQQSSRTRLKNEICEGAKVVRDAGKDAIDYGWGKVQDAASPFADRVEKLNQAFVDLTQAPPPPKPSFFSWTGQKQFWGKDLWTIFKI
jgi:hypothetical protein